MPGLLEPGFAKTGSLGTADAPMGPAVWKTGFPCEHADRGYSDHRGRHVESLFLVGDDDVQSPFQP